MVADGIQWALKNPSTRLLIATAFSPHIVVKNLEEALAEVPHQRYGYKFVLANGAEITVQDKGRHVKDYRNA